MSDGQTLGIFRSSFSNLPNRSAPPLIPNDKQQFSWSFDGYCQFLNQHKDTTPNCSDTEQDIEYNETASMTRSKRRYMAFPDDASTKSNQASSSASSMSISGLSTGFYYENLQPQTTDIFASKTCDSSLSEGTKTTSQNDAMTSGESEGDMSMEKREGDDEGCITLMGAVQTMDGDVERSLTFTDMKKMNVTMMGFENDLSKKIVFNEKQAITLMGCVDGKLSFNINDK